MDDRFFQKPILNSPYGYPSRHWELDAQGQPTQQIIEKRRGAEFITPIPKPRKHQNVLLPEAKVPYDMVNPAPERSTAFLQPLRRPPLGVDGGGAGRR